MADVAHPHPIGLVPAEAVKRAVLAVGVFLGGFVFIEPAPYELYFAAVVPLWFIAGLRLRSSFGPLVVLMLLFVAGGFLSAMLTRDGWFVDAIVYVVVTAFLAACAILFAALLAEDWRRFLTIERAYLAAAVIAALIGILAYFSLIPGAELFMLNSRAAGPFQDPNVFGPFLILPMLILARRIMVGDSPHPIRDGAFLLVLILGVFLSFSRAAWGMAAVGLVLLAFVVFSNFRTNRARLRLAGIATVGLVLVVVMLLVAISLPGVGDLLAERARLVQDYDAATGDRLGRFARHIVGFQWVTYLPLGIGPWEFPLYFIEATHNTYLKAFLEYGWLGGFSYLVLVPWTLAVGFPLMFRPRPWQGFVQAAYVAFALHAMVNLIIDTDHWRHMYLLFGLIWGLAAAERLHGRRAAALAPSS